ncbi:MAG: glycoside hydrolase family 127 protein [Clostridiales bacterium]|nr:glycoside hydrolase family 127 protein [Clostridiales bacterium]
MKKQTPLPPAGVRLTEGLAQRMQQLVRDKVVPYQWEILHDRVEGAAKSHCVENFRIAAGLSAGEHYGMVFQDSDLYKWLEAVAYTLEVFGDPALEAQADEMCELIRLAQQPDGYLNTYYTLCKEDGCAQKRQEGYEPCRVAGLPDGSDATGERLPGLGNRFGNLQQGHELYCAGHLFEAAAAYAAATGKRDLLQTACRFADYLVKVFGTGEGQLRGYPGHQEVEVGLVRLYEATGGKRYLDLADYFLSERGRKPLYFEAERKRKGFCDLFGQPALYLPTYAQIHARPVEQTDAVGHAVRALYMYSAMADLAALKSDPAMAHACAALHRSVTERRMYITGAVGSTHVGESFTGDYNLPDDTVYGESCASVALMMFESRMAALTGEGGPFDTVERAFFNRVLGGISLTGTEFFYVGPLAVDPAACRENPDLHHVTTVRQPWFDVACCPTNIARAIMSIGGYAYAEDGDTLYVNIPLAAEVRHAGHAVRVEGEYPYGGTVRITALADGQRVRLRQSGLAPAVALTLNGSPLPLAAERGYLILPELRLADTVEATLAMAPHYVAAHPGVTNNVGKAAVMRGPLVYCAEQADNGAGVAGLAFAEALACEESEAFTHDGAVALTVKGFKAAFAGDEALYRNALPVWEAAEIRLIPYYLWANRGEGEMRVYLNVR